MPVRNVLSEYLLELINCGLNERVPSEKPKNISWQEIFAFARLHSVFVVAFRAVQRISSTVDANVLNRWSEYYDKKIAQYATQEYELKLLCSTFEQLGISYMPLKGICIRKLYPQPELREMVDLDILVPKEHLAECEAQLQQKGYTICSRQSYHTELEKPPYIAVELHTALVSLGSEFYPFLSKPWENTEAAGTPLHRMQTADDEYIYLITHCAKHYYYCGTGIRSVLDIFIYRAFAGKALNNAYIYDSLEKMQLLHFAKLIEELANKWFSGSEKPLCEEAAIMAEIILNSSTHGSKESFAENTIRRLVEKGYSVKKAKRKYLKSRLFLKRTTMYRMFPVLRKAPILLPFCHLWRLIKLSLYKPRSLFRKIITITNLNLDRHKSKE